MSPSDEGNEARPIQKPVKSGIEGYSRHAMLITSAQLILAKVEQDEAKKAAKKDSKEEQPPNDVTEVFAQEAVLEAMAEIGEIYVREVGKYSRDQAELAGRTQSNLNDVLESLRRAMLVTQTSVRELAHVCMSQEIRFPRKLGSFPPEPRLEKKPQTAVLDIPVDGADTKKDKAGEAPVKKGDGPHIESWMPPLPPAYTYIATPAAGKGATAKANEQQVGKQRRQAEKELVKLTRKSAGRRSSSFMNENPFLRPPKAVSDVQHRGEDDVSRREVLEPEDATISAANGVAQNDGGDPDQNLRRLRVERILASSGVVGD